MTGVIKPGAAGFDGRIRPLAFDGLRAPSAPPPDPELVELRRRVADLEVLLAERDAAAEKLAAAVEAAFADGEAEGREAGRSEAEDRSGEALALLGASAGRAAAALEKRLEATDRLAALLARTCLEKMLGNRDARSDLVRGLISHQVEVLREEMIVEVRVSAEDFASVEAAAAAAPACAVTVSDALASGDCTIRLRLGALDIGLGQQWDVLRAALDEMVDGEGEA